MKKLETVKKNQKLQLTKKTISKLNNQQMKTLLGGNVDTSDTETLITCGDWSYNARCKTIKTTK